MVRKTRQGMKPSHRGEKSASGALRLHLLILWLCLTFTNQKEAETSKMTEPKKKVQKTAK
jgi:hypothetical protein